MNNLEKNKNRGLTQREAEKRLLKYGENVLQNAKRLSAWRILFNQFGDFMVLLLAAATAASALMGEMTEAITISIIIVLNALLGFAQEFRTEKTMEALRKMTMPEVFAVRDGKTVSVLASKVVPGDVLVLNAGDKVAADGTVAACEGLQVDESMLTGESEPVEKRKGDKLSMGTIIVGGHGYELVTATGMNTAMGEIAGMIGDIDNDRTPLQVNLDKMGKIIALGCVAICACVALIGVVRGENLFSMLLVGISLAVAAVPEGLSAVVAVALAIGVRRMLERKTLIRRLPAVETLGCASVICSDKTGTITQNRMTVRQMNVAGEELSLPAKVHIQSKAQVEDFLVKALLCSNIDDNLTTTNPTEKAIVKVAKQMLPDVGGRLIQFRKTEEIPFSSESKFMMTKHEVWEEGKVNTVRSGKTIVCLKGAPEVILGKCDRILEGEKVKVMTSKDRKKVLDENNRYAEKALRVIAVAYSEEVANSDTYSDRTSVVPAHNNEAASDVTSAMSEGKYIFMGMMGLMDPPRKEAVEGIKLCKQAGIRVVMITGDQKKTAEAIAREVGIAEVERAAEHVGDSIRVPRLSRVTQPERVPGVSGTTRGSGATGATRGSGAVKTARRSGETGMSGKSRMNERAGVPEATGIAGRSGETGATAVRRRSAKDDGMSQFQGATSGRTWPAVLSGAELDRLSDEEFGDSVRHVNVYARVMPRHKLRIVSELRRQGEVVAMTGDGVNDAPAVKEADIGIAMGKNGAEVTREASDMMLTDDNFGTIADAVSEGRLIFSNIRKFIRYLLACNIGEVLTMFAAMIFGLPLPLLPVQVLWVNLVTDGLPAIALGFDPGSSELMLARPRRRTDGIFSNGLGYLIITRGLLIGILTVGIFAYELMAGASLATARTCAFMLLVFMQLVHVFECKSENKTLLGINIFNNIGLIVSVLLSFGLTALVCILPVMNIIFKTVALTGACWIHIGLFTLVFAVVGAVMTKLKRH